MNTDQTLKGILLAFAAFAAFSLSDASVKLIEGALSPFEMAFLGALFGIAALPFVMKRGDSVADTLRTTNRPLWLIRACSAAIGTISSVTAFTHLSMAEAFALIFLLPSFVTIMSVVFLKEHVGLRRWSAVLIGFVGVLIVLRPGFRELSVGHVGAVFAGLSGAISIIVYRAVGSSEKGISLYGAGLIGSLLVCGVLMVPSFEWPTAAQWLMLAGYGLLAAVATILLMYATMYAPAALVGPTQYSQMLWAVLFGYLVFGDAVDLPMVVGIALVIASGLLTLTRERARNVPLPAAVVADPQGSAMAAADTANES